MVPLQRTHSRTLHTLLMLAYQHTLLNYHREVYATGPQSQRSSPVSIADVDDNVNTRSLMEQSEVQFNPAALERARQAGWRSQPRS